MGSKRLTLMWNFQKHSYWPGYDWASSSKKEVPWIGISCISQVQLPWDRLPGNGHVLPEMLPLISNSFCVFFVQYQWDSWAKHMLLFFLSTWGILDCNSNPCASSLCTDAWHWCTSPGQSQNRWLLTDFLFVHPLHSQRRPHTFWGRLYNCQRDKARLHVLSIALRSWPLGHKSPF